MAADFASADKIEKGETLTTYDRSTYYRYCPDSSSVTFTITSENEQTSISLYNADESDFQWVEYIWQNGQVVVGNINVEHSVLEGEYDTGKGGFSILSDKKTGKAVFQLNISTVKDSEIFINVFGYNSDSESVGKITISASDKDDAPKNDTIVSAPVSVRATSGSATSIKLTWKN